MTDSQVPANALDWRAFTSREIWLSSRRCSSLEWLQPQAHSLAEGYDPCLTHNEPAPAGAGSLVGLNAFSYWPLVTVTLVELAHA